MHQDGNLITMQAERLMFFEILAIPTQQNTSTLGAVAWLKPVANGAASHCRRGRAVPQLTSPKTAHALKSCGTLVH